MNILITGGAGFIGSNFTRYWKRVRPEDHITVIDKLTYAGTLDNLSDVLDNITFIQGDITDPITVDKAMTSQDIVVHFAAESHVDRSIHDPNLFIKTNVLGTGVLLDSARKHKVWRFHHVSTDEVYGHIELHENYKWNENQPYNPRSPYSASKAASDHLVRAYHNTYGLPITISNCANNIGPYMHPEKFLPRAITNVLQGKRIPVYTPGNQVREWLHVEDHCSAIQAIIEHGTTGETYFVGPNNPEYSNLEVIKILLDLMDKPHADWIEFVGDRPGHDQKYALDHSKITRELNWQPKYNLEQTLKQMISWYSQNTDYWKKRFAESEQFYTSINNSNMTTPHNKTKILIFGKGQMGQAYKEYFEQKQDVDCLIAENVDIRNIDQVREVLETFQPEIVINTAGKTNLDWCEMNQKECFDNNVLGPDKIAQACQEKGIYLVHLSSGCVQESLSPEEARKETDPPHPLAFYSWTKVWADNLLMERAYKNDMKLLIIRGRQLISAKASPRNALTKLITYNKFIDTPNSMTIVEDMVDATWQLIQKNATGIYNVANEGIMTPYKLALLLKEYVNPAMEVSKISKDELNKMTYAKRIDCVLDCSKLKSEGIYLKDAETRLRELLPIFKNNLDKAADVLERTKKETIEKLNLVNNK